jgi:lysophospholipase L1-like esterase
MMKQTTAISLCAIVLFGAAGCASKQMTQRQIWQQHVKMVQSINRESCSAGCYAFEGDSNMELINFQEYFTEPACNYSHRGSTTGDVLSRKEKMLELKPAAIVVLVGGNDVVQSIPEDRIVSNYEELIGFYKTICDRVYCISNLPINPGLTIKNSSMTHLNGRLEQTCRRLGATFVNVYPSLYRNGGLNADYAIDPVHLNKAGQDVLMGILKKYLAK